MKIFICNLNLNTTEIDLVDFFNNYITEKIDINYVTIVKDKITKKSRGFAYINFNSKYASLLLFLELS
jgi:RNA recognition motif-containing protein